MKNRNKPAFAVDREMCEISEIEEYPYGLTKLEYISTHILVGLCANSKLTQSTSVTIETAIYMAGLLLGKTEKQYDYDNDKDNT